MNEIRTIQTFSQGATAESAIWLLPRPTPSFYTIIKNKTKKFELDCFHCGCESEHIYQSEILRIAQPPPSRLLLGGATFKPLTADE